MTVYQALESRKRTLERLQEAEIQKQRLRILPALTDDLKRTVIAFERFFDWHRLWVDLYQQEALPDNHTLKQALAKPFKIIGDSEAVFNVSEDEIKSFLQDLRDLLDQLGKWQRKSEELTSRFCEKRTQAVKTTQALLQIPDLLDDETERQQIEELLSDLLELLDVRYMRDRRDGTSELAREWQSAWNKYEGLQSKLSLEALIQRFSLSQETATTLSCFINGETLHLGDVSASVLQELQQIRRFAAQVSLRFEAQQTR